MDQVVEMAQHIYKLSLAQTDVIDYDDQILFPLVKNIPVKFQKDLLILDEAQDSGRARQALINKFIKEGGCFVIVGDDRQGIYGFAGAQANALDALIEQHQMKVLPLTVCFRCPKTVIREAQKLVPDIEWHDDAAEGEVTTMTALPKEILKTDAILCRNTAPLIEQAYALLRAGIACKVEGRDIGVGLLTLVNRWKVSSIDAFLNKLEAYREREVQKAMARNNEEKAEQVNDKCATLVHLCRVCLDRQQQSLNDLRAFIDSIFADNVSGVATLCTYHRAKGREWTRVFLFEHSKRCPSRFARQEWQKAQESNLSYVAVTRAMETLIYVG
jgi:superfamily I DNA/RNA helicase